MLKIDVCSDLHVDRYMGGKTEFNSLGNPVHFNFETYKNSDSTVLVLAGDISDHVQELQEVIVEACRLYEHVVFVDGNHEFHGAMAWSTVRRDMDSIAAIAHIAENFVYLNGLDTTSFALGTTRFVGANCWYDWRCFEDRGIPFPIAFGSWDDNSKDANLDFGSYGWPNVMGAYQITNMEHELQEANDSSDVDSIVVVTHSAPLAECLKWGDDPWNQGSPSYVNSSLGKLFRHNSKNKIKLWVHGHTHNNKRWEHEGVTVINNCFGYPEEDKSGWKMQQFTI